MPAYWSLLSVTGPQFYRADSNTPRSVYFKIRQIAAVLEWRLHYMPSSLAQSQIDIAEPPQQALILDAAEAPEILLSKTLSYLGVD